MSLIPDFFSDNDRKANLRLFFIIFIISLIVIVTVIYFLFPGFLRGPIIEKIPIIIEENSDEVRNSWR
ncbi:MAG: hypothetical protein ACOC1N_02775 [Bacillota bacterium]